MLSNPPLQLEQLGNRKWLWYYTSPGGAQYRSAKTYPSRAAATKAGQHWLTRRANPRNRGR
jgi:hypothetical protein